jgi:hypothetical protein
MYYKIENQASEVYQRLHSLRSQEHRINEENLAAVTERVGLKFQQYWGRSGQQHFFRTYLYEGFLFEEPEKVDLKIWKKHSKEPLVFVPNRKTKAGREMGNFLLNGIQKGSYSRVFDILGIDHKYERFKFPYVEIIDKIIILYIGDNHEVKNTDLIEITSVEFNKILHKGDAFSHNQH